MTISKINRLIVTLTVLGVIVAWASGEKGPQDRIGLMTWEDNGSSCSGACQTREGTFYGCLNANQEECNKYTDWKDWEDGTCTWQEGFGWWWRSTDEEDDGNDGGDGGCGDNGCGDGCGNDGCYDGCY